MRLRPVLAEVIPSKQSLLNPFAENNPTFAVETPTMQGVWKVKRTLKDFYELRTFLLEHHPECIVPGMPGLRKNKDISDVKYASKLGRQSVQFLEACIQTPTLRTDKVLDKFVTDELPLKDWIVNYKRQAVRPRKID